METVTSADGTPIAYERTGSGPPLVLVHGTTADHTRWEPVRHALEEHFTVYAMDRRGRGESGDAAEYSLEREVEDVVAVVDAIDDSVALLGHSFGALCALEAALRTDNLRVLLLYEPAFPVGDHELYVEEQLAEVEELLDAGENEQALTVFLEEIVELPPEAIDAMRSAPNWPSRAEATHTVLRESQADGGYEFDPARFRNLTIPVLLLTGSESPPVLKDATDALNDALTNSRITVLEGQGHVAVSTAPDLFVDRVLAFLRDVGTEPMTENERLARRVPEDIATEGKFDLIEEVFAEDAVEHGAFLQDARGIDEIRTGLERFRSAFPDFRAAVEDAVTQGDTVAMRLTIRGTHQGEFMATEPTNKSFEVGVMVFTRIEDGKIVERWVQPDLFGLMQQLGVVELPGE